MEEIKEYIEKVKNKNPLIHHITNPVAMNFSANITLALGASPIMGMYWEEVEDIVEKSHTLVLNLGTLNRESSQAIMLAGKKANELNIPIILDPVGIGISRYRRIFLEEFLKEVKVDIIKGNQGEIQTLAGSTNNTKGVDVEREISLEKMEKVAKKLSKDLDTVIVVTGSKDLVVEKEKSLVLEGGSEKLTLITATGCALGSIIGSYLSITDSFTAGAIGLKTMAKAGELATEEMMEKETGLGNYPIYLINWISRFSKLNK